jgi:hypothetical protein
MLRRAFAGRRAVFVVLLVVAGVVVLGPTGLARQIVTAAVWHEVFHAISHGFGGGHIPHRGWK